jgi:hypothetical protein
MLTPTEFQQWCEALHLSAQTVDLIARIRGEMVSFPPYPPPTKRRAQAIPRWIRQGAVWILYSKSV